MIFRNSLLSLLRSGWKTALFTVLLIATTLTLALGAGVWVSIAQFLDECDDFFTTIGLVEYMGTRYPNDTEYDAAMHTALAAFDPALVAADEAALRWETPARSLGYVEGFWRTDNMMPDPLLSVLVVGNVVYDSKNDVYNTVVQEALYSSKSVDRKILIIDGDFGALEEGHIYLVFGEIYQRKSPLLRLRAASFDNAIAAASGIELPRLVDITSSSTDGRRYEIPQDSVLLKVAETLPVTNNSVLVSGTDDLMALLPFHQQELYIIEGRAFTEEEYAQGSRVAVISEVMAKRVGAGVGDTLQLSVAVSDQPGVYNSYWVESGFSYQAPFTVVGIMNTVLDKNWYVYVPRAAGVPVSPYPIGYTVGTAVIDNEEAAEYFARVRPSLGDRYQLTLYDQGYSTVAAPYQTILRIAIIATAVCFLLMLAVVILFGFLFVYRQREAGKTMQMLGASRMQVSLHFLYSAGILSLAAAAAGAAAAYRLHEGVLAWVARSAENYALIDARYSNGNLTIARTLEFAPDLQIQFFAWVGAAVFLLAILSCLAFTLAGFRRNRPRQLKNSGPKAGQRTSRLNGGSLKFALLSMRRGGPRSLVVPILAVAMVFFFGQLSATSLRYQEQLEAIFDNTTIQGYYTDIHGKQIGNQVLNAYDVAALYRSGQISSLSISLSRPYYFLGASQRSGSSGTELQPLYVPDNGFAQEALEETIERGPDLTATNNLRSAPEFFYANSIRTTFLDGYDESFLAAPSGDPQTFTCLLPSSLMAQQGIALGDTVRVAINHITLTPEMDARIFQHFDLLVVGSYEKQGAEDTIYVPLPLFFETPLIWDAGQPTLEAPAETFIDGYIHTPEQKDRLQSMVFHSAAFNLADSHALAALKDYLTDYGYSQVQKVSRVREFIVLEDATFNNAVASVRQQIQYINTLYPVLYMLAGIIALIVSYLLIASRKAEFATMRGLGSPRISAFLSFFYEQSILCLLGTAAGLALWSLWNPPARLHLMLTAAFLGCYFAGCAIAIMILNQTKVLAILLDRD